MIKTAVILIILGGIALFSPTVIIRILTFILPSNHFIGFPTYGLKNSSIDKEVLHKSGAALIVRVLGGIILFIGTAGLIYTI